MRNALVGFIAGAATTSMLFFVLGQGSREPFVLGDTEIAPETLVVQDVPQPTIGDSPDPITQASASDDETGELASETSFNGMIVTGRSREDLSRLGEQSFAFWGDNKDRFDSFAGEIREAGPAATTLENSVTSEVWRVAGATFPPAFFDTECRSSACRVRLSYGTPEQLSAAVQSNLDLWVLAGLEPYGFVSADMTPEWDFRALDPDPDAPGESLDIYFWLESPGAQ